MISPPNISRTRVITRAGKRLKQFFSFKKMLSICIIGNFLLYFGSFIMKKLLIVVVRWCKKNFLSTAYVWPVVMDVLSVGSFFSHFLPIFSFKCYKKTAQKTFQKQRCCNDRFKSFFQFFFFLRIKDNAKFIKRKLSNNTVLKSLKTINTTCGSLVAYMLYTAFI